MTCHPIAAQRRPWLRRASRTLRHLGCIIAYGEAALAQAASLEIPPTHPAIVVSDHVASETAPDGALRLHRILDVPGKGYRWDNPGARISFRTDAREVIVRLRYSEKHTSPTARAPVGIYLIDGRHDESWSFTTKTTTTQRPVEELRLALPTPNDGRLHDYAIVMPYGDSVDFCGLTLNAGAALAAPAPRPSLRYVAYGDSVTHGFTATRVDRTYVYRVAEARGWQSVNLGLGGRTARPTEGAVVGDLRGDLVTILIGGNDWQTGIAPNDYQRNMRGLLTHLRERQPTVPVFVITPLWVSENWKPERARYPLEEYRVVLRALVKELADPALSLVEGLTLIDHEERYFDRILVHPNDAGFAQMAERLAPLLKISRSPAEAR